jgi:hypothetical protein
MDLNHTPPSDILDYACKIVYKSFHPMLFEVRILEKLSGIVGLTPGFSSAISDLKPGSKVVFVGSPYVCTPFIELLAYAVRDRNFRMVFLPGTEEGEARKIKELGGIGYCISEERADPYEPDAVVLLGGLAMPKFGYSVEEVRDLVDRLSREKRAKLLGVGFMGIFKKQGWDRVLKFEKLIDATIEVEVI